MAKKVTGYIKLQIPAGKATPAPPVGPALGQHGVNIVEFTKQFNAKTADQDGMIIPVVITVYNDRSFSFITKTPPAAVLIKKACNLKSGSGVPNKTKVATISKDKVREIAEMKMPDLNAASIEAAKAIEAALQNADKNDPIIKQIADRCDFLIKKACGIKSGSGVPNKTKVATITKAQLEEIAKLKMPDLNAASVEAAMSMIAGTCRSMGVKVEE